MRLSDGAFVGAYSVGSGPFGVAFDGQQIWVADTLPKGLAVGDVNRDGHTDIAVCTSWGYDGIALLGDGLGAFHSVSPPNEIDGDGEPVRLVLADFNKDGRLDIAMNAPEDDKILLYFGDGKGNFPAPAKEIDGVPKSYAMTVGDVNHDGNLDLIVDCPSQPAGSSQITVLLGDGMGDFNQLNVSTIGEPASVQVGDLNGDGNPDLVVAGALPKNTSGNFIVTYLGDGTGTFTMKQTLNLGQGSLRGDVALGDFDEDGKLDVAFPVTSLQLHGTKSTKLLLFFGDGTGNLNAGPVLTVGQEPHTVIALDFNHDGHLDLAVSNRSDGTVTALAGDGHGNFTVTSTTSILSPIK